MLERSNRVKRVGQLNQNGATPVGIKVGLLPIHEPAGRAEGWVPVGITVGLHKQGSDGMIPVVKVDVVKESPTCKIHQNKLGFGPSISI